MSFATANEVEQQPHAHVQFDADEVKASVPLNFILSHPPNWREKKAWNDSYLYKVFWSPIDNDSPSKMLKSVAAIPLYDKGMFKEKPGYYRASVLAVDESLSALADRLQKKRLSVPLLKYKHTSFDASTETKPKGDAKGSHSKNAQGSKKPVKPKSKGLNRDAHRKNLNFEASLESKFSFLGNVKKEIAAQPVRDSAGPSASRDYAGPSSGRDSDGLSSSHLLFTSRNKKKCNESSSSEDTDLELGDGSKKIKLDPNYTPKSRTTELEDKLKLTERNLDSAYKRNKKLEADRNSIQCQLDKTISDLAQLKQNMQKQIDNLQRELNSKIAEVAELKEQLEFLHKHNKGNDNTFDLVCDDKDSNGAKQSGDSSQDCQGPSRCDGSYGDTPDSLTPWKLELKYGENNNSDNGDDLAVKLQESNDITEDYELTPGVFIKVSIWNAIKDIPKQVKKDKIFIKDLTMAAFGPEVLASSTICGTKKGGRKKSGEKDEEEAATPDVKPGLNRTILKAVREQLIKRVEDAQKQKIEEPDEHQRTKRKVFHDAIRDGQKRLIQLKYGSGIKDNTVTESLLFK